MKRTANYALPDWEKSDFIKMDDFNDLTAKLDAALKAEADARAAGDSTASESLTALHQTVTKSKLCRIKYGSYVGTGTYGSDQPIYISCDFVPAMLAIVTPDGTTGVNPPRLAVRNYDKMLPQGSYGVCLITWGDTSLSWYGGSAEAQYNATGFNYHYIVLGFDA